MMAPIAFPKFSSVQSTEATLAVRFTTTGVTVSPEVVVPSWLLQDISAKHKIITPSSKVSLCFAILRFLKSKFLNPENSKMTGNSIEFVFKEKSC
jgi:hypothetical protein